MINAGFGNTKFGSELPEALTGGESENQSPYLTLRKPVVAVGLANRTSGTALCNAVIRIVLTVAQKQMARITARWVVAMVKNRQSFGNWSKGINPRHSMREHGFTIKTLTVGGSAITPRIFTSGPIPALVWSGFVNMTIKSFFLRHISPLGKISKSRCFYSERFEFDRFHSIKMPHSFGGVN